MSLESSAFEHPDFVTRFKVCRCGQLIRWWEKRNAPRWISRHHFCAGCAAAHFPRVRAYPPLTDKDLEGIH